MLYLGLGSNQGNRRDNLENASKLLSSFFKITKYSRVYETKPLYYETQGHFLNQVIEIKTTINLNEILFLVQNIERALGRQRHKDLRYGPRVIDIDILLYGNIVYKSHELIVPHPHMLERRFVLEPLCEIDSDLICPINKKPIKDYLNFVLDQDIAVVN